VENPKNPPKNYELVTSSGKLGYKVSMQKSSVFLFIFWQYWVFELRALGLLGRPSTT
jgi:hypothetical protein